VNRPGVTVRTRSGYYAGETTQVTGKSGLIAPDDAAPLQGVLPRRDVPLGVSVAPFAIPGRPESAVAAVLNVKQTANVGQARRDAPITVLAAAFDRSGRAVKVVSQTAAVTWPAKSDGTMSYEVVSRLDLPPGRYEVRLAANAGVNQQASVYSYVDVPDFTGQPLSLSGIAINVAPPLLSAPKGKFADLLPLEPTAVRQFKTSDRVKAFVRVYQAAKKPAAPVTVRARVVDATDQQVFEDVATLDAGRFQSGRGADYTIDLPVDRLKSGEYLLTTDATQGQLNARRGVRFSVQ
jgi:hypothetical protein